MPASVSDDGTTSSADLVLRSLTLHAHCGEILRTLRACMRENTLPSDPILLLKEKRDGPCQDLMAEYQRCGRDFIETVSTSYILKCEQQVLAARRCAEEHGADAVRECEKFELAAIQCLSKKVLAARPRTLVLLLFTRMLACIQVIKQMSSGRMLPEPLARIAGES